MKNNKKMLAKMEITNKAYGTPTYKSGMIGNWKRKGVVHDNFDALFEEYIATTECQYCGKDFTSTKDRCVDHNHETGEFRLIVCQKCNAKDSYINWPDGYDRELACKEFRRQNKEKKAEWDVEYRKQNKEKFAERASEYRRQNKEKIAEISSEKIKCECGAVVRRDGLAKHRKSKKHLSKI